MPQQTLDDMIRSAQEDLDAEKKKKPEATSVTPPKSGLDAQIKKANQDLEAEKKNKQNEGSDAFSRWAWTWQEPLEAGKHALQGVGAGAIHTGEQLYDAAQFWLAQQVPGYLPKYAAESKEARALGTPPEGFWGGAGYTAEQMAEMYYAGKLVPWAIRGKGVVPGLLRIGGEAGVGGGVTGVQTGSKEEAVKGAVLGAAGGVVGEVAGAKAPEKMQEALRWKEDVPMAVREEAAARAVQRAAVVPVTAAEDIANYPHLNPEIAKFKGIVDNITKRMPGPAQRSIPIRDVLDPVNKMIRDVRMSDPDIARALARKRDQWLEQLGFRGYKPATPATPARIVRQPVMSGGYQEVDQFGNPMFKNVLIPAKPASPAIQPRTTVTVAEVQNFKESFNTSLPKSAFGQKPKGAAMTAAKLATRKAARETIEEAVPEKFRQYGDRTVKELNRIIERDIRLREAVRRTIKKNPNLAYRMLPVIIGGETLGGIATQQFEGGRAHRNLIGTGLLLTAGAAVAAATRNPLAMARMMTWIRDSGVAVPATAYAAWRSALDDPSFIAPEGGATSGTGGGVGAPQPEQPGGGGRGAPRAATSPGGQANIPKLLAANSVKYGVPLEVLHKIANQETGGLQDRATAVSPKGAIGVMQVTPATGAGYGFTEDDLKDPAKNIEASARYMAWLLYRFGGDTTKALAAYNAGPGTVEKYGGVPPYKETQKYVK